MTENFRGFLDRLRHEKELAEQFAEHDYQSVMRALGKPHADEKLRQDTRGRMCIRGSALAAKLPVIA